MFRAQSERQRAALRNLPEQVIDSDAIDHVPSTRMEDLAAFCCPLSQDLMHDPVLAADGRMYEFSEISKYYAQPAALAGRLVSPVTRGVITDKTLRPMPQVRAYIKERFPQWPVGSQASGEASPGLQALVLPARPRHPFQALVSLLTLAVSRRVGPPSGNVANHWASEPATELFENRRLRFDEAFSRQIFVGQQRYRVEFRRRTTTLLDDHNFVRAVAAYQAGTRLQPLGFAFNGQNNLAVVGRELSAPEMITVQGFSVPQLRRLFLISTASSVQGPVHRIESYGSNDIQIFSQAERPWTVRII